MPFPTRAPIVLTCLSCSAETSVSWSGRRLQISACPCGSFEFRLSGGASGLLSHTCKDFDSAARIEAVDQTSAEVWEAFCSLLDTLKFPMAGGNRTDRFCAVCQIRLHNSLHPDCGCFCHAARRLRKRIEDRAARLIPAALEVKEVLPVPEGESSALPPPLEFDSEHLPEV